MKIDMYEKMASYVDNSACLFTEMTDGKRLTWEITGRCQMGCKHCCNSATGDTKTCEPATDQAKYTAREIVENGVKAVYLSGGEPLLWNGVFEFLQDAKASGLDLVSMATNGGMVTAENARLLREAKLDKVLVSLDSHVESVHDQFRNAPGSYSKAVNAARLFSDEGVFVRVGTTIWSGNVETIPEFIETVRGIGADEIAFNWLVKTGRALEHPEIFLPDERYFEVGGRLSELRDEYADRIKISYHRFKKIGPETRGCFGGEKFLHINSAGKLTPCSWVGKFYPEYVSEGCLYTDGMDKVLAEGKIDKFRDAIKKREERHGPGCPIICQIANGTMDSPDPLFEMQ